MTAPDAAHRDRSTCLAHQEESIYDISSVIALGKLENDGERTKADETIWTRQIADPKHVRRKSTVFIGVS
jgi:hypothetical protein